MDRTFVAHDKVLTRCDEFAAYVGRVATAHPRRTPGLSGSDRDSKGIRALGIFVETVGMSVAATREQKEHFMKMATRLVLAAAVLVTTTAASANAQVLDRITFKTNFPFVAGNTTLPAGSYTVTPMDDDPSVLELSNGKVSVLLDTEGDQPARAPSKTEVTFNKYGNTYVLHEILDPEAQGGAVMLPAHAEKRHQKTHGAPTPQVVPASKTSKK